MSLAGLLRLDSLFKGTTRPRPLAALCAIDVVSQLLCQYGLTVAGSSLYVSLLPLLRSLYPPATPATPARLPEAALQAHPTHSRAPPARRAHART